MNIGVQSLSLTSTTDQFSLNLKSSQQKTSDLKEVMQDSATLTSDLKQTNQDLQTSANKSIKQTILIYSATFFLGVIVGGVVVVAVSF